jgi:hypothetical protein
MVVITAAEYGDHSPAHLERRALPVTDPTDARHRHIGSVWRILGTTIHDVLAWLRGILSLAIRVCAILLLQFVCSMSHSSYLSPSPNRATISPRAFPGRRAAAAMESSPIMEGTMVSLKGHFPRPARRGL